METSYRIVADRKERLERVETWTTTMVNACLISRLSQAVDQIENRLKQNRRWKVVEVLWRARGGGASAPLRGPPEDRGANVVIFKFCPGEELADEG